MEENKNEEKLTPHELVRKHILNKDHKVTDEMIDKLKVGAEAEDDTEVAKDAELLKDEIEKISHHHNPPNPYDII